jgi:hydrogenase/urease accessory protein HupE
VSRWTLVGLFGAALLLVATLARAHDSRPAILTLVETAPGQFSMRWTGPVDEGTGRVIAEPRFPGHCNLRDARVDCGSRGLTGTIAFVARTAAVSRVTVVIHWLSEGSETRTASGSPPSLEVRGTPDGASLAQRFELLVEYGLMGVEHIVFGVDHVAFVLGLLLFVRSFRRLLLTVTAFTVAHSLTLALVTLGAWSPPVLVVELCIALSILLLAVEATQREATWTERVPWAVAFGFGLLHGFGFASALRDVGLPPRHVPLSLGAFNLGVELGQVAIVALVIALQRLVRRRVRVNEISRKVFVIALGGAGVYWCLDRAHALVSSWGVG